VFKANYIDAPVATTIEIRASASWHDQAFDAKYAVVQGIINNNVGTIHSFVNGQVQNARGKAFWGHEYVSYNWSARFSSNSGQMLCAITVMPENAPTSNTSIASDLNLDGYIFFLFEGEIGTAKPDISYEFLLNGQQIGSYYGDPDLNSGILFLFGQTAARCQSLVDETKTHPELPGNPNAATKPGIFRPVLPARSQVAAFTNNGGVDVAAFDDLPGYFMYDYIHPLNVGGQNINLGAGKYDNPTIINTFVVANPSEVLNEYKLNKFRVKLNPATTFSNTWGANYRMYAEFFSRQEVRTVTQGWKLSGDSVSVNDKPLYFQMSAGAFPTLALDIDLTPNKIDHAKATQLNYSQAYDNESTFDDLTNVADYETPRLTQWKDGGTGYWRAGDYASQQPQPPNSPWGYALTSVEQAAQSWFNIIYLMLMTLGQSVQYDGDPPGGGSYTGYGLDTYMRVFKARTDLEKATGVKYMSPLLPVIPGTYKFPELNHIICTASATQAGLSDIDGPWTPWGNSNYGFDGPYGPTGQYYIYYKNTYPWAQIAGYYDDAVSGLDDMTAILPTVQDKYSTANIYDADGEAQSFANQAYTSAQRADEIMQALYNGGSYQITAWQEIQTYANPHAGVTASDELVGSRTADDYVWGVKTGIAAAINSSKLDYPYTGPTGMLPLVTLPGSGTDEAVWPEAVPNFAHLAQATQYVGDIDKPDQGMYSALGVALTPLYLYEEVVTAAKFIEFEVTMLNSLIDAMNTYTTP
jgi:hypothetical protein